MDCRTPALVLLLVILLAIPTDAARVVSGPGKHLSVGATWPAELKERVNDPSRIWGDQGFLDTWAYYAGDTETLNTFLATIATAPDTRLLAILHPGPRILKARESGPDRDLHVNWLLHIAEHHHSRSDAESFQGQSYLATVDIWIGMNIDLQILRMPAHVELSSGQEIETFVRAHEKKRAG